MTPFALYRGFFKLGAMAFGGTGPLSHALIVDDRRWLDEAEFAALIGLCQALPGANTCNLAVMLGARFCGARGAFAALAGLLTAPLLILIAAARFIVAFSSQPDVRAALYGATAAAAGLALGTAIKMIVKIPFSWRLLALSCAAFAGAAPLKIPFPILLGVLAPLSFALARPPR